MLPAVAAVVPARAPVPGARHGGAPLPRRALALALLAPHVARARPSRPALRDAADLGRVAFPVFEEPGALPKALKELPLEGTEEQWQGLWRVAYAPHIRTLGSLAFSKFDVYYDISAKEKKEKVTIRSYVRCENPLWRGWLNASGKMSTLPDGQVEVDFEKFWVAARHLFLAIRSHLSSSF